MLESVKLKKAGENMFRYKAIKDVRFRAMDLKDESKKKEYELKEGEEIVFPREAKHVDLEFLGKESGEMKISKKKKKKGE